MAATMKMIQSQQNTIFTVLATIAFVCSTTVAAPNKGKKGKGSKKPPPVNHDAKELAKAIPQYSPKVATKEAVEQMKNVIQLLTKSNRDSVSSNSALIKKALDFRPEIGAQQKSTTTGAILKAWEVAFDYGALGFDNSFTGTATKGRYKGERLVFENIVPGGKFPECAGYIGNLRLVPESMSRNRQRTPANRMDEAYIIGLKQIVHEAKNHADMLRPLSMSLEEYEKRWQAEAKATGEAYKFPPNLKLHGQRMSSPSVINDYKHILRVEITNTSRHPTEVVIESSIVGYTQNGNKTYEMRKDIRKIKLRRSEVHEYVIKTPSVDVFKEPLKKFDPKKSQRVSYRGYTIIAKFNGEVVATKGSDGRMDRVATGEYPAPVMIAKQSRAGNKPIGASGAGGGGAHRLIKFTSLIDLASGKNGSIISKGPGNTIGLMHDGTRLYQLNSSGQLTIYKDTSFDALSEPIGQVFAGPNVRSIMSDSSYYYLHLTQPAGGYKANAIIKFNSLADFISGKNGTAVAVAGTATAALMSDGKQVAKAHLAQKQFLMTAPDLNSFFDKTKGKTVGELFCKTNLKGLFSDGESYYIQTSAPLAK